MNIPIQTIENQLLTLKKIKLYIKREDLNHPIISGNKLRKLKYNIVEAKKQKHNTLLTFGGAYSNHIIATAYAAQQNGLQSIGIIRGEELSKLPINEYNETLQAAISYGMKLHFVSRTTYRNKDSNLFIADLQKQLGSFYLLPEGGTNALAVQGTSEILTEIDINDYSHICCPIGTGGTIAGLIQASKPHQKILGFSALKSDDFFTPTIAQYTKNSNFEVINEEVFGGYAKFTPLLISFINSFKQQYNIPLEPIYTGKMIYNLFQMIENNTFQPNSSILAIHTGGLQAISGINTILQKQKKTTIL